MLTLGGCNYLPGRAGDPLDLKTTFNWTLACGPNGFLPHNGVHKMEIPLEATYEIPSLTLMFSVSPVKCENEDNIAHSPSDYETESIFAYECRVTNEGIMPKHVVIITVLSHRGREDRIIRTTRVSSSARSFAFHMFSDDLPRIKDTVVLEITIEIDRSNDVAKYTDELCEKRNEHTKKDLLDMLKTGHLSDVKIITKDGKEFLAHKLILSAGSEVFKAMFHHRMAESSSGVVNLDNMSANAVTFLLHFLYSGQMLPVSTNWGEKENATIQEVLYLSSKYGLKELTAYFDENIELFCNQKNAWELLKLCKMHSLENGKEVVYSFLKGNHENSIKDFVLSQV